MTPMVRTAVFPTVLCLLILSACSNDAPQKAKVAPAVMVVEAASRSLPVYTEYIGETYGRADVDVVSRVEGWITGIHFKEGQALKQPNY